MIQHLCMNIEGAIANAKYLKGAITVNGETLNTAKEIRSFLRGQPAMGRRVLPMCRCSNFDYQKGCLGHAKREEWLMLKHLGLGEPTIVVYEGKELVTAGLDLDSLVKTWRDIFDLHDCVIWLEAPEKTIRAVSEPLTPTVKSVRERFAEHEVYFWEGENE